MAGSYNTDEAKSDKTRWAEEKLWNKCVGSGR